MYLEELAHQEILLYELNINKKILVKLLILILIGFIYINLRDIQKYLQGIIKSSRTHLSCKKIE